MRDGDQRLAVAVALLLVGGVLIGQGLIGTWGTFAAAVVLILGGYLAPAIIRWLAVRRFRQQLAQWERSA
ncbi:hypothetical protein ABZ478_19375 [Streptomyces sp. NPDC005706]|uniref:hypothetical protein n=1 Tax=Streptomyces sp. NPDC005706 TaxID=3157169 RepID=UPI0033F95811